jgi:hypothetical protein
VPVIGFLDPESYGARAPFLLSLRQGLNEAGYCEGQNVAIEFHWRKVNTIDSQRWRRTWFAIMSR